MGTLEDIYSRARSKGIKTFKKILKKSKMDYCECLVNSSLGQSLLNFIRRYQRQYCSGDECPVDGRPRNDANSNDNETRNQAVVIFFSLIILILSLGMQYRNRNHRQNEENSSEKRPVNNGSDGNDRDPPPSVN